MHRQEVPVFEGPGIHVVGSARQDLGSRAHGGGEVEHHIAPPVVAQVDLGLDVLDVVHLLPTAAAVRLDERRVLRSIQVTENNYLMTHLTHFY